MATVNLGAIKFKWKGTYDALTAYTIDDVVSYNGSSYICISNSTGNLPTNATYFEQMSQAGTDGTDLTTTLTTQGDLVYYNGSALARLGAGTSGQVLQTNGTGANPSWGTVSTPIKTITVQEDNTRRAPSAGGTLISGNYTQANANGDILINLNLSAKAPNNDGANSMVFTYDGTTYTHFISYTYTGHEWITSIVGQFKVSGSSTTGSKSWSLSNGSAGGVGKSSVDVINPNSSDHANFSQSTSTITFMEY